MKREGLTILEAMITIFIFSLILAVIFGVMTQGRISFYTGNTAIELRQEMRKAIFWMKRELHQSRSTVIQGVPVDGNDYNVITFRIPQDRDGDGDVIDSRGDIEWSDEIRYSLVNGQVIRRTPNEGSSVLANNIRFLGFRRQTPRILEINIQARKRPLFGPQIEANLITRIALRN